MSFLSPLDLLLMNDDEQTVLSICTRRQNATLGYIAQMSGIARDEVERLLSYLVRNSQLVEKTLNGQSVYQTRYGVGARSIRNMPHSLDLLG